jgi:hypothetical protein
MQAVTHSQWGQASATALYTEAGMVYPVTSINLKHLVMPTVFFFSRYKHTFWGLTIA